MIKLWLILGLTIALPHHLASPVYSQVSDGINWVNDGRYWVRDSDFTIIVRDGQLVRCNGGYSQGGANRCGNMKVRNFSIHCTVWLIVNSEEITLMRKNKSACEGV